MEDEFNYQAVPYGYTHCFNGHCSKEKKCLHRLVAVHSTKEYPTLTVVNPNCIPADGNNCPYYKSIQKIRMAWGIRLLLDNILHKDAVSIKNQMISHFGRSMYYRFYRKEHSINPEQQDYIRQLFRKNGIAKEPQFEYYTDEYKW